MTENIKTAVITGGHSFDVLGFHKLFRGLAGVDAYIQHIGDFAASKEAVRDSYDVVLFYFFLQEGPTDEHPWYEGKHKTALEHLGETEQGIVVMHHALLAYPHWPVWSEIVGIEDRSFKYYHGETVPVTVANSNTLITQGLSDWEMIDETYAMTDAGPGSEILLTTTHPKSMHTLAWARTYKNARVFCFESGHDNQTYVNPSFQTVLTRGIRWAARRL
jgi:hypothetical protein